MKKLISVLAVLMWFTAFAQPAAKVGSKIIPAAWRTEKYLPLLKNKRVALFANNTSTVGNTHLADTLSKLGVKIQKIFAPEHGFRGKADAGETVMTSRDSATGILVVSLYGKKRKPTREDLDDVDLILFDIQDVGVRFYTYISSLQDLLEAAQANQKPLIVLDRPNPNGFYVDGPVLQPRFRSFVGMQPVPVVYGMTIGEYAQMLLGEKMLSDSTVKIRRSLLTIIPCANYTHCSKYVLPEKPSPNLPDMSAVYWYPSTCFFEGTALSEGRGTDHPFQMFGHPALPDSLFSFTPTSRPGARDPKLVNQRCFGWNLAGDPEVVLRQVNGRLQLRWLLEAYQLFPQKDSFFIHAGRTFNTLAGNDQLIAQIRSGQSEQTIRASWKPALDAFKKVRKKYLLYKDYE